MQVFVENPNTIVIDVDQGRQGRGITNITYTEVSGQYYLIVTYTDGTSQTLGPLVVTGGAAFLLGGTTGALPYQTAPNTTGFLAIGTANQVVVAGASAPQYTSNLTGLTVNNTPVGNTTPSSGAFTTLSASGAFSLTGDQVQISEGGTGQTTANAAFNALAPSQTGNAGKYLKTDGTNSAWDQLDISTADITGTLPIANGGTGQTTANSALNALLPTQSAQSGKYLKTDGTNASWDQLDISTADITGILPVVNGGTGASTASGARANLSAAVLGTNNDITSLTGVTGGISTPDFVQFDTTATEANAVGKVYWDAAQGTLDLGLLGGNVISRIGQSLVAYVTNAEAVTITKGQAVYLFSAQGNRATVKLASNLSDATSAKTFGVVAENITANGTGFVMCQGVLEGLNLGAYTAGDTLYLGATPGSLTATKPYAPNHLVYVGLVERANPGNGQLYVKVQNGYELDEIHDVQIVSPQNGQTIIYDASTSLWKNANLTAGSGVSVTNGAASITVSNTGVLSFSGGTTGLTPATSTTGAVTLGGTLNVANGGTGATNAADARTNLNAASQSTTISAGTGLTGGGDLSANRTLSIANTTVTAGAYGSASNTLTATVNAQGQLTALAATPIAIANTQVSGLGTMSTQNSNSVTITGGSITGITDLAIADGGTGASDAATARTNLGLGSAAVLNAGVALGVATLDAGGTVPLTQIPASIQGGVNYQGSWNASTNTPTIVSSVGSKGYYYVVSVAGNTNINGITDWLPGDWIIFNGSVWEKIDNTDAVASVNGYTGAVVLTAADVGAPPTSRTITAGTGLTGGGDLSANRTISIANTTVAAGAYGSASSVGTFTVNGQGQLTAAASTPIAITNTQVSGLGTLSTQNANSVSITGGAIDGTTIGGTTRAAGSFTTLTLTNALGIANGGTGQTTANAAFNALAPSQVGNSGKYLTTDGTNTSWATNPLGTVTSVDVSGGTTGLTTSGGPVTSSGTITLAGTLATTNGGTGLTSFTANGVVYASSTSALTTGSALVFDGTKLGINRTPSAGFSLDVDTSNGSYQRLIGSDQGNVRLRFSNGGAGGRIWELVGGLPGANNANFSIFDVTGGITPFTIDSSGVITALKDAVVNGITVGRGAGAVSTNTAVGASALAANTTGAVNTAVGYLALNLETSGTRNAAFGARALQKANGGTDNTAVGYVSLSENTTGIHNTAVGEAALGNQTTGNYNTALGSNSLINNTTASNNTAVGYQAGYSSTGVDNCFIGYQAGFTNTTGTQNVYVGRSAGAIVSSSTGSNNSVLGFGALVNLTSGSNNIAIGTSALQANTTASNGTAVGYQALYANTTGANNSAFGHNALYTNSTGSYNVAVGLQSLFSNTTASYNTAVGYQSLFANTGERNTSVGYTALTANTTGIHNAAFGMQTLVSNTTGSYNTAYGSNALASNTTASNNTAVGYQAGYSGTTGFGNAYFGTQAGYTNTTAAYNLFLGYQAGYSYNASGNTFNTFVGIQAGYSVTTGTKNTILGGYSGNQGGLDIRTADGYIVLSDGDGNPRGVFDNGGLFIAGATAATSQAHTFQTSVNNSNSLVAINATTGTPYGIQSRYTGVDPNNTGSSYFEAYNSVLGGYRFYVRSNGGISNYQANDTNLSDRREKTNFAPAGEYLSKICAIPVQTFNYIDQNMEEDGGLTLGVVAQDVQAVAPELVMESNWAGPDDEPRMRLSIYQTDLQYALMKCIQELKSELDSVKAELATLKGV